MEQVLDVESEDAGLSPTLSLAGGMKASQTCAPGTNTSPGLDRAGVPPAGRFCGLLHAFQQELPPRFEFPGVPSMCFMGWLACPLVSAAVFLFCFCSPR